VDYSKVKTELKEIVEIASKVPEQFREKTFTVLLDHLIAGLDRTPLKAAQQDAPKVPIDLGQPPSAGAEPSSKIKIPASVRVWMTKTGVTADELGSVLMVEESEVHFIREPSAKKNAQGQIEWSLLLALKQGLENNNLSVDPEAVRSICQEKGYYDSANFTKYFRTPKNARLFRGVLEPQGEARSLTSEGQVALGKLVKMLAVSSA